MEIQRTADAGVAVLAISGPMVEEALETLHEQTHACAELGIFRLVLDLEEVPFIDSKALEAVHDLASDLGKRGGDLRLAAPNEVCQDIFLATRLQNFVHMCDSREIAVRSLL